MEDLKKYSSLPSNYVSIVELQQRWLEQQQRKQRESEESQENQSQNDNEKRTKSSPLSISRRTYRSNRRNQTVTDRRTAEVAAPKSEESQIEAVPVVVVNGEQNTEKSKKKKKRNRTKNGKPRVEENLTGGTAHFSPGPVNEAEDKFPVAVNERNGEKFRRKGDDRGVNPKVWEQKVRVDPNSEIRRNLEDLSLNGGREGKGRSTAEMNGGDRKYSRGFGRFDQRKERDCNLVWVIKGERPDTDVAGIRLSGTRQWLEKTRTAQDY